MEDEKEEETARSGGKKYVARTGRLLNVESMLSYTKLLRSFFQHDDRIEFFNDRVVTPHRRS